MPIELAAHTPTGARLVTVAERLSHQLAARAAEHDRDGTYPFDPDTDRFLSIDHQLTESGVPRISSAIAFLECEPVSEHLAGDHWIVVAHVQQIVADHGRDPLIFSDGRLGSFVDLEAQEP